VNPIYIMWLPLDQDGAELEQSDEDYLDGGEGCVIPAIGDLVVLNGQDWRVVRRVWVNPVIEKRAMTPCQAVTLHIQQVPGGPMSDPLAEGKERSGP
jgi:hypothetical protein